MKALRSMIKTELILTIRSMDSVFFGIIFPVALALILGFIYGNKPAFDGAAYTSLQLAFGAVISIGICATGLMGVPLSVSYYRHMKILKRYQVTPVSPAMLLFTQVMIQFIVAIISFLGVLAVMKLFFEYKMQGSVGLFLISYLLVVSSMYGLGMLIASLAKNIKIANLICTLLYFPMLFLSGATVPYDIMPKPLQGFSDFLLLTQGIKLLKEVSLGLHSSGMYLTVAVLAGSAVISILLSIKFFRWE